MFVEFKIDNLNSFGDDLKTLLDRQQNTIDKITNSESMSYQEIMRPLQDLDEELSLFFTPLSHLNSVNNSKKTQEAYQDALPLLSKFSSKMAQNRPLFEKIERIKSNNEEERVVLENDIKSFLLSGINLDDTKKTRLEEISLRLSELSNNFSQNLLDATNDFELIIEDFEDIKELPQTDIDLSKVNEEEKEVYRFTLQIPSYLAYMTYGSNRKHRKSLSKAYSTRAPQNAKVIDEILALKYEKSKILGFESYASYSLEEKDAPSQDAVISFLNNLINESFSQAQEEMNELKAYALKSDNISDFEGYDIGYYSEKLKKEKFDFDDSDTKPYFEQNRVLDGLVEIISELFDVEFKEAKVAKWDEGVKVFDIYEKGNLSSRIYFDLNARESKRGGAWMNDWETHYLDAEGKQHLASAFVVCNFSPSSKETPSLLTHDNVVTLFHEMGHAIHHLFAKCKERNVSGINGVDWDVVEFPSQFLENFAYESAILKKFGFHYETQEPISDVLLAKIKDTKNFQAGIGLLRQVEFSLFDFMLHQKLYCGDEVQNLLDTIREKTALLQTPKYNKFQHGFAHIFAGGYSAGYYSYKWAEVLSADAFFECIDEKSGFNKEKAKGYKENILAKGSSKKMNVLYTDWLEREASVESLTKLYDL